MKRFLQKIKQVGGKLWVYLQKSNVTFPLIISLVGGVPGVINIWDWANEQPKFQFHAESLTDGEYFRDGVPPFYFFLITGAIYNDGKTPLFPATFVLEAEFPDTTFRIGATVIDSSLFKGKSAGIKMHFDSPSARDLLRVIRVNSADAVYGALLFQIRTINLKQYNINTCKSLKITCIDIALKRRTHTIDIERFHDVKGGYASPKTGTTRY